MSTEDWQWREQIRAAATEVTPGVAIVEQNILTATDDIIMYRIV